MDDFWEYIINDLQNLEFRIEDTILHSLTGIWIAIGLRLKALYKKLKSLIKT